MRRQATLPQDVFCKETVEKAVSFLGSVVDPGTHGQIFCSDLTFFNLNKSLRSQTETVEDAEADAEGSKERLPYVFEIEEQPLIYTKSAGVYRTDLCSTDLYHAFVSKTAIRFSRNVLTWKRSLKIVSYTVRGETSF